MDNINFLKLISAKRLRKYFIFLKCSYISIIFISIMTNFVFAKGIIHNKNYINHNKEDTKSCKTTGYVETKKNIGKDTKKTSKEVEISIRTRLRLEDWDTFNRLNSNQDNTYQNLLSLTELQLKSTKKKNYDYEARINFAKFLQLPENASFGTGSAYYRGGFRESNFKPYLRLLYFSFYECDRKLRLDIGRFDYNDVIEWRSKNKDLEWIKEFRLSGRILAIANFQIFQRSMNGLNINFDQKFYNLNFSAWKPTTGTTHEQAGDIMNDVKVFTLSNTFKFGKILENNELQLFGYKYKDNRNITVNRPDNSRPPIRTTNGINIDINSFGFWTIGLHEIGKGRFDYTLWYTYQTGNWFDLDHKAYAYLYELGYKFKESKYEPWIRAGLYKSSGDSDPFDNKHKTFYTYLPFNRRYSRSLTFGFQNLNDKFIQLITQPNKNLRLEVEYHKIKLSEGNDMWYNGGGPIANTGSIFGLTTNNTNGSTDLGTSIDFAFNYKVNKESQLNFAFSKFNGGSVISNNFNSKADQIFYYLEYIYEFKL